MSRVENQQNILHFNQEQDIVIINPEPNPHVKPVIYPKGGSGHPFRSQSGLLFTRAVCVSFAQVLLP